MKSISPCAKINLGLNVVGKRPDGYHELQTVFYPVAIHDEIVLSESSDIHHPCSLVTEGAPVECAPDKNLIVRAYHAVAKRHQLPPVKIVLRKRIPMQAGMGGGSADAAYTIRLLNEVFHLSMTSREMADIAVTLGADCPFFIYATPAYAEGIGERLNPVALSLSAYALVVVKPPVSVSTREAFANIRPSVPQRNCADIVREPVETWKNELFNDFENSIFPQYPLLASIKQQLYELGAVYASMSGSGSSLFGIFEQPPVASQELFKGCETIIIPHAAPGPF